MWHLTFDIRYQKYQISTSTDCRSNQSINLNIWNWNDIIRYGNDIHQLSTAFTFTMAIGIVLEYIHYLLSILHLNSCIALYFYLSIHSIYFLFGSRHNLLLLLLLLQRASSSTLTDNSIIKNGTVYQLLFSILKMIVFVLSFPVLWKGFSWSLPEMIAFWQYFSNDNFIEY